MGKHVHNCIMKVGVPMDNIHANVRVYIIHGRDTLAPRASNAQGGPLCQRGGCVRTLRTPPAYGLAARAHPANRA